jgi:hypothetical protein
MNAATIWRHHLLKQGEYGCGAVSYAGTTATLN